MNIFYFILGFCVGWFCYGGCIMFLALRDSIGAAGPSRIGDDQDAT